MIKEFFPSARHLQWHKPPVTLTDDEFAFTELSLTPVEATSRDVLQAAKLGLPIEVYQLRCKEVLVASNACSFMVGDTGYPTIPKEHKKYGLMQVVGVCRTYDSYGSVDWNDPPFILSVSPLNDRSTIVQCTAGWLSKKVEVSNEC